MSQVSHNLTTVNKKKFLGEIRYSILIKNNGLLTEGSYAHRSKVFILFHNKQPPCK